MFMYLFVNIKDYKMFISHDTGRVSQNLQFSLNRPCPNFDHFKVLLTRVTLRMSKQATIDFQCIASSNTHLRAAVKSSQQEPQVNR